MKLTTFGKLFYTALNINFVAKVTKSLMTEKLGGRCPVKGCQYLRRGKNGIPTKEFCDFHEKNHE
jgi:hypothetical protein